MKKPVAILAGLTLAGSVFAPVATAQEAAAQKVLLANCTQMIDRTKQPDDFHGSVPNTQDNVPVKVSLPENVQAGKESTLQVTFPTIEGRQALKSAFQAQQALGLGKDARPFISVKNFQSEVTSTNGKVEVNSAKSFDLGQSFPRENTNKIVYNMAIADSLYVDFTPEQAGEVKIVLQGLSFELHAAAEKGAETKRVSTVNCKFKENGKNSFANQVAVTDGNVLASLTAKEAAPAEQPAEPMDPKPAEPMDPKPAEPMTPMPGEPMTPMPGDTDTKPAEPMEPKPSEPIEQKPAEPMEPAPTDPSEEPKPEPKPAPKPAPWSFESISQTVVAAISGLINAVMPLLSRVLSIFNFIPGVNF